MYFKTLELVGFKSFSEKTTLHFEPGITAVVGPNGCGKSNIFDSIRWVLGEQSVKALRGSDMQDVIFNGTDTKEPLSMAEVTLTFDNKTKFFNVDHHEVAITRRIFRSGESEYLLNKTQVRLKDILDILMGTGIGAESYSLIQQGKIDLVLSSRPEDRRLVFDEAAGITKYKSQKREATRKLEETDQNLLRVNDIITEVRRQIGSLERQANKARRYKEVFEELKTKEVNLAIIRKEELLKEREGIARHLKDLEAKEAELIDAIKLQEDGISSRQNELKSSEENIAQLKSEILNLENIGLRDSQHIAFNKERIAELETSALYLASQTENLEKRILQDEEKLNTFKLEYAGLSKNIEDKTLLFKSKDNELTQISASIKSSLEIIAAAKRNIMELVTKISHAKNACNDLLSKQQICFARKKRLELENLKINEEKTQQQASLNAITAEVAGLEESFSGLNSKISEIKKALEDTSTEIKSLDADMENLQRQSSSLISQKEFLEKLKTEYEGIGESMNAVIFLDKLPQEKISGLVIKVNSDNVGQEASGFKFSGEAKPIELNSEKINARLQELELKIDSLKIIKRMKEAHIEELNKELSLLQDNLHNQEIALANKRAYLATIEEQFNKIKSEEELLVLELSEISSTLSVLETDIIAHQADLSALENEEESSEDSISAEQNNITANNKLKEEALVVITQLKTELEALNKRISSDEQTLKILEDTLTQDQSSLAALKIQINDAQERQSNLKIEISELENKITAASQDIQKLSGLLHQAQDEFTLRMSESGGVFEKIEADKKELDEIKGKVYELQMQNKDADFKYLNIKDRILQAYKIDLDILGIFEASETSAETTPVLQQPVLNEDELAQAIDALKQKLDSYGTVNLVAIEEYDELKKRYDFLTQQQNDLVTAKDSLHEAILKINRTTKKMFLETFEKVKVEFRNYFRLLFNGGDAQVFLIDENDPLESGIEIICRPPGKKLQNVLLLSGGEKSMSAIALIFAIFKIKPAPFCILDEIDAALDEANVDRFGRMLQDFARDSQFIMITHNKKTIANATVMYGITMEQSGVSKIVSVKLAQNKQVKEKDKEPDQVVTEPV
ncbi:MAG: AAA family ATPase [Candidatus Omnitrophica bacterium]|jgi:chromosome segregation protein|nr:AAA family ATPase [Candidatus Omnitrophota bacterium]